MNWDDIRPGDMYTYNDVVQLIIFVGVDAHKQVLWFTVRNGQLRNHRGTGFIYPDLFKIYRSGQLLP